MLDAIIENLKKYKVEIITEHKLTEVIIKDNKVVKIRTEKQDFTSQDFVFTIPSLYLADLIQNASLSLSKKLKSIEYFGAICIILELNKRLSEVYWLNIADDSFPFGGIIEHTNFVDRSKYNNRYVAYLSRYFAMNEPIAKMTNKEIQEMMIARLPEIYPEFDRSWIENVYLFKTNTAATVCDMNFSRKIPDCRTEIKNLYIANMSHVYPDERSTNNSIRIAKETLKVMGIGHRKTKKNQFSLRTNWIPMISIVIPLFNEEDNISLLYERITEAGKTWDETYELILVDDGSYDSSLEQLKRLASKDSRIRIIKLSRNFGHQAAITAGLRYATGDAAVIMDGDLQDPPEELSIFLDKWREGYHVVYAVRVKRKENFLKKIAYSMFYRILQLISNINIPLDSGDFCVMDKKIVKILNTEMIEHARFVRGLRAYSGFRQIGVQYERKKRVAGESKYTFRKLVKLAIDGLLDFSTLPLRISTYLGFFIAIPSFLLGSSFLLFRILDVKILGYSPSDVPGFASLAVGIFFLGGIILIMLGVIGEYIGRIYFEVKKRPFFIIDEIYSHENIN